MPKVCPVILLWSLWISAGLSLDLATWLGLRAVPVLAADPPGSAGVIALTLIHGFVLPSLFAGDDRRASRLLLGFGVALVAVPVALLLALVTGFLVLNLPLLAIIALSPPQDDYVARQETGFLLRVVFDVLEGAMAAPPGLGGAVAALSAGGIAATTPRFADRFYPTVSRWQAYGPRPYCSCRTGGPLGSVMPGVRRRCCSRRRSHRSCS